MAKLNDTVMFACNLGGHFSEMMGLSGLFGKYESVLVTDNVRATGDVAALKHIAHIEIIEGETAQRGKLKDGDSGSRWVYLGTYFRMLFSCNAVWKKYRPKVIVSTGSNIAVLLFLVGKLRGSKTIYVESRAKVYARSMTGILVRKMADQIYVQWPEMLKLYPEAAYCGTLA